MTTLYKILITLTLVLGLLGSITYLYKDNIKLRTQISTQVINAKSVDRGVIQYKTKDGVEHTESIQQSKTIALLQNEKDSIMHALLDSVTKYKVKLNSVTQLGSVSTQASTTSTVKFLYKDTTYTLSKPELYHVVSIKDGQLKDSLSLSNRQSLIWATHKETIAPPRKFFLWRLFQAKQLVTDVTIINSNKLIHTEDQKFSLIQP